MGSVEVLDAMMQCSGTMASISRMTLCFTPISSKTASITRSACWKWRCHDLEVSARPTTFERIESWPYCVRRFFFSLAPMFFAICASPRDKPFRSLSLRSTRMPFAAETSAIPAPISPAPSTATVFTLTAGAPNLFFFDSVWPKKSPRSAADSCVALSLPNNSRSALEPAAWPDSRPALAHSRIAGGAGYLPLVAFSIFVVACEKRTLRPTGVFSRNQSSQLSLRALVLRVPLAASRATCTAARSSALGSTTKSTRPIFFALSDLIVLPVSSMSSAAVAPTSLGSRCVPPHPGKSPSITSGRPSTVFALDVATRCLHVIAISSPPPRHDPSIAATHGVFPCIFSIRSNAICPS
mmetsp:Transcript_33007/g.80260  ORF Transcript_33007/g.80260 Transcript_33007/m.80260 type:complete len:353 (-) Transcript_33007:339-1397(-)